MQSWECARAGALIIGGGLTGLMAARCLPPGETTIILQPGGGASPHVMGLSMPLHRDDSPELFLEDTLRNGGGLSDPALARRLCLDSLAVRDELEAMGFAFDRGADGEYALRQALGTSRPRVAGRKNDSGAWILHLLTEEISRREGTRVVPWRALRLLADERGVCGALAFDGAKGCFVRISARAVLLACGGFCGVFPFSTNTPDIAGDGVAMAYDAGATLVDLERIQLEPSAAIWPPEVRGEGMITTLFFEGAVLKNGKGERFMLRHSARGECVNKAALSRCILAQIAAGNASPHGGVWFDATAVGRRRLETAYDVFVRRYARCGVDISREPVEIRPAPHTSLGGVAINDQCETGVPGLFAAGEVAGGLHGADRLGGNAGLETLVFGRAAGVRMREYLADAPPLRNARLRLGGGAPLPAGDGEAMRARMKELLSDPLPDAGRAASAHQELAALAARAKHAALPGDTRQAFALLRLQNDLVCARLFTRAALEHARGKGRVTIQKGAHGPRVTREAIQIER